MQLTGFPWIFAKDMRIFATSDLHTDYGQNWEYLERLSCSDFRADVLIVAGDICHRIHIVERTLALLLTKFDKIFFVPGNHELWAVGESENSQVKFHRLIELCRLMGVKTGMSRVGPYKIVPLFSWYDPTFSGANCPAKGLAAWADFRFCRWPQDTCPQWRYFARLNEDRLDAGGGEIISFSHFLPRLELLPDVDHLHFRGLPCVAGSRVIDTQLRVLGTSVHVFGHSHIRRDQRIDGIRYVQRALGYPRERDTLDFELLQLK